MIFGEKTTLPLRTQAICVTYLGCALFGALLCPLPDLDHRFRNLGVLKLSRLNLFLSPSPGIPNIEAPVRILGRDDARPPCPRPHGVAHGEGGGRQDVPGPCENEKGFTGGEKPIRLLLERQNESGTRGEGGLSSVWRRWLSLIGGNLGTRQQPSNPYQPGLTGYRAISEFWRSSWEHSCPLPRRLRWDSTTCGAPGRY
jgi:hypothetical protein